MAKKQEFLAADSFLFWNADDVRPIRARLDDSVCTRPDSSYTQGGHRKLLKSPGPSQGHWNAFALVHAGFFSCCIFIFGSGSDLRYFTRTEIQSWVWLALWQAEGQACRAGQSCGWFSLCRAHREQGGVQKSVPVIRHTSVVWCTAAM